MVEVRHDWDHPELIRVLEAMQVEARTLRKIPERSRVTGLRGREVQACVAALTREWDRFCSDSQELIDDAREMIRDASA